MKQHNTNLAEQNEHLTETLDNLRVAHHRFHALFDGLPTACYACDLEGVICDWNRAATHLFGFAPHEVLSRPLWEVFSAGSPDVQETHIRACQESLRDVFEGQSHRDIEMQVRDKWGNAVQLLCSTFPILMPDGRITGAMSACLDVTRRKELEKQVVSELQRATKLNRQLEKKQRELEQANLRLAELVTTDGLTGLKNHRHFRERLEDSFAFALRSDLPLSVIMVDVDDFKQYNDTFGHPAGDEVLRTVATLLLENTHAEHLVARYGGEEFVLLLTATNSTHAHTAAERLREAIAGRPWPLRDVTISLGVATTTPSTSSPSALVEEADQALYHSKRSGRNRVTYYRQILEPLSEPLRLVS